MNIQAMMQQAQKMQKDLIKSKKEIEEKIYISNNSFVTIEMFGNKKIKNIIIEEETLDKDDIEILKDSILICINENIDKIDKDMNDKLGKFGNLGGLF